MKFGKLSLIKIIKFVAVICHILQLKCIKFDFGWGCAPDPTGRAYSALQTLWLDLSGLLPREGRGGKTGRKCKRRGGEGQKERRGRNLRPILLQNLGIESTESWSCSGEDYITKCGLNV